MYIIARREGIDTCNTHSHVLQDLGKLISMTHPLRPLFMLELSQCFLVSFTADVEALRVKLIAQGESEEEVESCPIGTL